MAIKGKSKSRGAKAVTRGPKPAYVPVRTPLLRRRGVWIGVGTVLGIAVIAAIVVGLVQQRNTTREDERLERMAEAVGEFSRAVEPVLLTVGQPAPPTGFSAFPSLGGAITDLEDEDVNQQAVDGAAEAAEAVETSAREAAGLFREIDATEFVRGRELPPEFVLYLVKANEGFAQAMDLYRQVALLTTMAADAEEGEARDELLARARAVNDAATAVFARAYQDYVETQIAAGTIAAPAAPPALPILTGPTGGR
jgi:hypothetical protein